MSRLTGNEVANMMEAYSAVYAPQQEEVVENVEKIDEKMDVFSTPAMKSAQQQAATQLLTGKKPPAKPDYLKPAVTAGAAKFFTKPGAETDKSWEVARQKAGVSKPTRPAGSGNPPAGSGNPPAGTKTAPAASSVVLAKKGGVEGKLDKATGKFTAGAFTGAERDRYVARGGSAAPAPGTKAAGPESIKPKTPNPLMDKTFGYQSGNAPDQIAKASAGASPTPSGSALGAAAKPEVRKALNLPIKPVDTAGATAATTKPDTGITKTQSSMAADPNTGKKPFKPFGEEVDLFDVILEHLLEEGYAETEKAALTIMANMGEEWRESIVEAKYGTKAGRKALAKKIRAGKNIGKKGPGTGFKAVEKAAKEGGAKDPAGVAAAQMWKTYGK